jgi:hypothetical protein
MIPGFPFPPPWLLLALKAIAAVGFMTAANVVILYAC